MPGIFEISNGTSLQSDLRLLYAVLLSVVSSTCRSKPARIAARNTHILKIVRMQYRVSLQKTKGTKREHLHYRLKNPFSQASRMTHSLSLSSGRLLCVFTPFFLFFLHVFLSRRLILSLRYYYVSQTCGLHNERLCVKRTVASLCGMHKRFAPVQPECLSALVASPHAGYALFLTAVR